MPRKAIVTSGAMCTKVDSVREIMNTSTGSLGSKFADELAKENMSVVYVHTRTAILPKSKSIKLVEIEDSRGLLDVLTEELLGEENPIVIHAMAIADFKIPTVISIDKLFEISQMGLATKADFINEISQIPKPEKLSSSTDQFAYFKRDLKVIDQIKKKKPSAYLVGFKLLSDVSDEELLDVANKMMQRTDSDIVVANIKERINASGHEAYIVDENGEILVHQKEEIVQTVIKKVRDR